MYSDDEIRQIILDRGSQTPILKGKAASILIRTSDERFLTIALNMLRENNDEQIEAALLSIINLGKFRHPDILQDILPFLDMPRYCEWVLLLLIRVPIMDKRKVPNLLRFLESPNENIRFNALKAIDHLKCPIYKRLEIALLLLSDASSKVRGLACMILGNLHHPIAVEALISKLSDNAEGFYARGTVAMEAVQALTKINDKRAIVPLQNLVRFGQSDAASEALENLRYFAEDFSEFYSELKNHSSETIRLTTLTLMGVIGDTRATETIIDIAYKDTSQTVQNMALFALKEIGTKEALEAVEYWNKYHRRNHEF
jgi:HEAT repeat protein